MRKCANVQIESRSMFYLNTPFAYLHIGTFAHLTYDFTRNKLGQRRA
jgi:hypothetical protein